MNTVISILNSNSSEYIDYEWNIIKINENSY